MNKVFLLSIAMFILLSVISVHAVTTITTCQDLNSDDTYELANDLVYDYGNATSGGYCLGLYSANIVIDCKGYKIFASDYSPNIVAIIDSAFGNLEVRNCTLEGGYSGIDKRYGTSYIHDVTVKKMSGIGVSLYTSDSANLTNINFTQIRGIYTYPWEGGGGYCNYNYTNLKDIDSGLPIEYYNTPVSISNRELAELTLCQAYNSNLTNITIRRDYIPNWNNDTVEPLSYFGTWLYSSGSDNLTITDSKFINVQYVNLRNSAGGYNFRTTVVNSNVTNWSYSPFGGLFTGGGASASCSYYNFTNVYVDGYPFVYAQGGSGNSITNGTYGGIQLCNEQNMLIQDVYTDWFSAGQYCDNITVDRLYTNQSEKFRNIQFYGSGTTFTLKNSVLWNRLWAVYVRLASGTIMNSSIGNYFSIPIDSYAPLYERSSVTVRHYNNIISRGSSSNWYLFDGQSATIYWDDGIGTGNYYTNSTNNDFSDTCVDTTPADGICDSTFNPLQVGTDNYPLSAKPVLNLPSPPSCSEGEHRCNGLNREVCSSGVWTFVETCTYGCTSGSCDEAPPEEECTGRFCSLLNDVGGGISGFFNAIARPLAYPILLFGIIVGILTIFYGIASILKNLGY